MIETNQDKAQALLQQLNEAFEGADAQRTKLRKLLTAAQEMHRPTTAWQERLKVYLKTPQARTLAAAHQLTMAHLLDYLDMSSTNERGVHIVVGQILSAEGYVRAMAGHQHGSFYVRVEKAPPAELSKAA